MLRRTLIVSLFLPLALLTGCRTDQGVPETPEAVDPIDAETLLENDYVEVYEVALEPDGALPEHEAGHRVIYALTDFTLQVEHNGEQTIRNFEQGSVHTHEPDVHQVTNVGDSLANYVVFERSELAFELYADGDTLSSGDIDVVEGETLLENDDLIVWRVDLEPGEVMAPHGGPAQVIYALSACALEAIDPANISDQMVVLEAGGVGFRERVLYALENAGTETASLLLIDYRF